MELVGRFLADLSLKSWIHDHNHVHDVDTNRHLICNLCRFHMYGIFIGSGYTAYRYHRLCIDPINILFSTII